MLACSPANYVCLSSRVQALLCALAEEEAKSPSKALVQAFVVLHVPASNLLNGSEVAAKRTAAEVRLCLWQASHGMLCADPAAPDSSRCHFRKTVGRWTWLRLDVEGTWVVTNVHKLSDNQPSPIVLVTNESMLVVFRQLQEKSGSPSNTGHSRCQRRIAAKENGTAGDVKQD
jgi:hypothetical protein